MESIEETYKSIIPERYLHNVAQRVNSINKKLVKRGVKPFELTVGDRVIKNIAPSNSRESVNVPAIEITIKGEVYKQPDHRLVGIFQRGEAGEPNRLKAIGDFKFSNEQQFADERCDCCKSNRQRKHLFLIERTNEANKGEVLQIGGDCAEIYLGVSPEKAINTIGLYEEAWNLIKAEENAGWDNEVDERAGIGGRSTLLSLYLDAVACEIRKNGWVSSAQAGDLGGISTSYAAREIAHKHSEQIEPKDVALASIALAHFQELYPLNDKQPLDEFAANMKAVVHSTHLSSKSFGMAAWVVQGYLKEQQLQREKIAQTESIHVAEVGQTIIGCVEVNKINYFDSQYGRTYLASLSDPQGNMLLIKSASLADEIQVGAILEVKAKVKEHSEYKNAKQTRISHVKVLQVLDVMDDVPMQVEVIEKKKKAKKDSALSM